MKYFTPDRWLRFQNVDDERALCAAHADWEQALAAYRAELGRALPLLPAELRRFAEGECLHDATLLGDWKSKDCLHLLVKPEPPANDRALLGYVLVEAPRVIFAALPPEQRTAHAGWLYDEIGVEEEGEEATPAVFRHSILLSDGRQITIRFRAFTFGHFPVGLPGPAMPSDPAISGALEHAASPSS
jgi:hypothetical protein